MTKRFLDKSILLGFVISIFVGFFIYTLGFRDINEKAYISYKEDAENLNKSIIFDLDKYNHFINGLKAFTAINVITDENLGEYFRQINIDRSYKDLIYIKYKNNKNINYFYFDDNSFTSEEYHLSFDDLKNDYIIQYYLPLGKNKEIHAYLNLNEILSRNINNFSKFDNLKFKFIDNEEDQKQFILKEKIKKEFAFKTNLSMNSKNYNILLYTKEPQKYYNGHKILIILSIFGSFLFFLLWLLYNRIWSAQFIAADIAEKATKDLIKMAWYDSLTGLYNRAKCLNFIDYKISNNKLKGFQLYFIDLNGFKRVNDTLGHHAGDIILHEYAERLKAVIPEEHILSRVGGDEFVILIDKQNGKNEIDWINLIKEATKDLFIIGNYKFALSQSIGISSYPEDGNDNETLLKHADIAMYQAKKSDTEEYVIYDNSVGKDLIERNMMESDLIDSIKNNELYLVYQPKISFINNTYKVIGAEALIRWNSPRWGEVGPDKFIPIAEQNGFIEELSDWLLQIVCENINKWKKDFNKKIPISINLSGKQFLNPTLGEEILEKIKNNKVDPNLITIEITEGTIMKQPDIAKKIISFLRYYGLKVSMDDFGTGYSSFSYLSRFMIDELKIDKSFIRQANKTNLDKSVVEAIVLMAHKLNLNVIAEGVETEEQLTLLKQIGCDNFQGYYFSKPLLESEFIQSLN